MIANFNTNEAGYCISGKGWRLRLLAGADVSADCRSKNAIKESSPRSKNAIKEVHDEVGLLSSRKCTHIPLSISH
jgi:hypothetical protein